MFKIIAFATSLFTRFKWSKSIYLSKTANGFEGSINIQWSEKITFKFIVDGNWFVHESLPTETEPGGFVNNVYTAPPKPVEQPLDVQPEGNGHAVEGNGSIPAVASTNGFPQLLSEIANTIAARDGTSTPLEYVASGIGAALHSVVGVDPINIQKVCQFPDISSLF